MTTVHLEKIQELNEKISRLEKAAKQAEAVLNSCIEIPDGALVFSVDTDFCYLAFNSFYKEYIKKMFGFDISVGDNLLKVIKKSTYYTTEKQNITNVFTGAEFSKKGKFVVSSEEQYFEDVYRKIVNSSDEIIGATVFYTNITYRMHSEKMWSALLKISEAVHSVDTLEDLLAETHIQLSNLIDTTNFFVSLYDAEHDVYSFPYLVDKYEKIENIRPKQLGKSMTDYVRRTGLPLLADEKTDRELVAVGEVEMVGIPARSWLGVPLKTAGKIIGVMVVQSYTLASLFSERDLELMSFVSDHIAMAVERKKLEQEFRANEERLKIAQKIAHVGHWELNLRTRIIRASAEGFRIWGFPAHSSHLAVSFAAEQIHSVDENRVYEAFNQLITGNKNLDIEFKILRADNWQERVLHLRGELNYEDGVAVKVLGMVQDVTEQNLVHEDLRRAKQKAEETNELKLAFLANMSHEIRSPMNAIVGFTRLLSHHDVSDNQRLEYQNFIINSGNNLLQLIEDIIDVTKIEAGQFSFNDDVCEINSILHGLHSSFNKQKELLEKKNIQILIELPTDNEELTIISDELRVKQILSNLIGNALKFTQRGHVKFGYVWENPKSKKVLKFFVKDTGIGIPSDKIDLIFSRFGQVIDRRVKHIGTGLGLSISKYLVEHLGGNIWVESEVGEGTTFFFSLPYRPSNSVKKIMPPKRKVLKYSWKHKKILIVEDDKINQTLIIDTLLRYDKNLEISLAQNGQEAIEKLEVSYFDLIIMDIRMPIMDGNETTKHIRTRMPEPRSKTPILGLTAHAMKDERRKSFASGMNDFLSKPFIPEELFEKINTFFGAYPVDTEVDTEISPMLDNDYELIDLENLHKIYKRDKKKIAHILKLYLHNLPNQFEELEIYYKDENWSAVRIVAHTLKTNFNYLGATDYQAIAKEIETLATQENGGQHIEKLIQQFKESWILLEREIYNAIKKLP